MAIEIKETKAIKKLTVQGYSRNKRDILDQIELIRSSTPHVTKKSTEELLSMTRETVHQIDNIIDILQRYRDIYYKYNKSNHTSADIDMLETDLEDWR